MLESDSTEDWDAMEACETKDACDADVAGILRPKAALGVKLGILEALGPHVAAFLLVASPVATGACRAAHDRQQQVSWS